MEIDGVGRWILSCLLLSLRIAPVFGFAPPFSLIRIPATVRMLMGMGLAACLLAGHPTAVLTDVRLSHLVVAGAHELLIGTVFVLGFQVTFAALYVAGRTIDIQAGFGLALLIDPTSRAQTPLVGTLFAYAAGAVFFALDGPSELLRLFDSSLTAFPLGALALPETIAPLGLFMTAMFLTAFGVVGGAVLVLFLADVIIAAMSRTIPQMNVLVLGFQVKTLLLLLVLPAAFGMGGALFARMLAATLTAIRRLL